MPLDVLGHTRATMVGSMGFCRPFASLCEVEAAPCLERLGNPLNPRRDGARFLQLLIFNEEFLVCARHQRAQNASLPFVHTARRSYRLRGVVRGVELASLLWVPAKLFEPHLLEEAEVVTRFP